MQLDSFSNDFSESSSVTNTDASAGTNTDFLRRYARRLLRDAHSSQPSKAMPVMRRVHAAGVFPIPRLADLYRSRETLRLKHTLHTIAMELGYATWAACKQHVDGQPAASLDRFRVDAGAFGDYNKVWFADEASARAWQDKSGGHVVLYGKQAVVMTR